MSEEDAKWFAKAQKLYGELQRLDKVVAIGAIPGTGKPYGFAAHGSKGTVFTVVNPSQEVAAISLLPHNGLVTPGMDRAVLQRILYADQGFVPYLEKGFVSMGPEQLVVIGTGEYGDASYGLGTDADIRVPVSSQKLDLSFTSRGKNLVGGQAPAQGKTLRILFQQYGADGFPVRSWGGSPPDGRKMSELLVIRARQAGKELPLAIEYDKMIWSGLSWGAAELRQGSFDPSRPVDIECASAEKDDLRLEARVYAVVYK